MRAALSQLRIPGSPAIVAAAALLLQLAAPALQLCHEAGHARNAAGLARGEAGVGWLAADRAAGDSDSECFLCQAAAHGKHLAGSTVGAMRAPSPAIASALQAASDSSPGRDHGRLAARAPPSLG